MIISRRRYEEALEDARRSERMREYRNTEDLNVHKTFDGMEKMLDEMERRISSIESMLKEIGFRIINKES